MAITWPAKNNYATGDVLTAANMNGIGDDLNALFDNSKYAGKNKIINGDFGIWQRGTSVTIATGYGYGCDRWRTYSYSASSSTISQQTFTAGTAPVAGYEGTYFARFASTATSTVASQCIESVRTFAGQTVTLSFWAKSASNQTLSSVNLVQNFGSGGSAGVVTSGTAPAITTSWARYSITYNVPSISGKTIGTGDNLEVSIVGAANNNLDLWGVQLEAGSTATPFQTATGTIQGELAACQRYYSKTFLQATAPAQNAGRTSAAEWGSPNAGAVGTVHRITYPVTMRIAPTITGYNPSAANAQVRNASRAADCTSTSVSGTDGYGQNWANISYTSASSTVAGDVLTFHIAADAEL